MAGAPKRRPFPYDASISTDSGTTYTGLMLVRSDKKDSTPLVASRPPDQSGVAPSDFGYSADNPMFGKWQPWGNLGKGLGYKNQQNWEDYGYRYCINADLSLGTPWLKGPNISTIYLREVSLNAEAATNPGGGLVGIPCTAHGFAIGETVILRGTTNYDGSYTAHANTTANLIVITATYVAETFTTDDKARYGGAVTHFFEIEKSATNTLFAAQGRYVVERDGGDTASDWKVATGGTNYGKDLGSGNAATDVAVFYTNVSGGAKYAYLALGETDGIYRFDGTTFAQHAEATVLYATALCVVGNEFYRAHSTNALAKCDTDADPFLETNWTAGTAFVVGDKSSAIVRLAVTATGALLVFKTDGVYTLNEAGDYYSIFPHLRFTPSSDNGKANATWLNDNYVTYREGTFRITPDFTLEQIGPEKLTSNDSEVRGPVTAMQGHDTFNLYAGFYNSDTGDSYLCKFGAWLTDNQGTATRQDVWHGSISSKFEDKKITALYRSTIGAPSGHTRLYIGFSDGTIGWFTLPCTPNPAACSNYTFSTTDGEVYLPVWHGLFKNDVKALRALTVTGENLSSTNYAQVSYSLDNNASYTALADDSSTTYSFDAASGRERNEFPANTSATTAMFKVILKSTATTSCPRITGMGLNHQVRDTQIRMKYDFMVACVDGMIRRDGVRVRLGADDIRDIVKAAAQDYSSVKIVFPDESTHDVSLAYQGEAIGWDERAKQWKGAIALEAIEFKTSIVQGLYSSMEARTYTLLEGYTYAGLETL